MKAGSISYEADLRRETETWKFANVPPEGVRFTGFKRGVQPVQALRPLATEKGGPLTTVRFLVSGDWLTLAAYKKGFGSLFPPEVHVLKLDRSELEWRRLKGK